MYFAVVKMSFESMPAKVGGGEGRRELHSVLEKIRSRFKVCAAACSNEDDSGQASIAITALSSSEEKLSQTIDAIAEFCESVGFGRVESEDALLDHIDAVGDYEQDKPDPN